MRKMMCLLAASVWLWAACAGAEPANDAANAPGAGPTIAPVVVAPTDTPAREIKTDFVATDPSTVQLAAGKPQLVEFFAVW